MKTHIIPVIVVIGAASNLLFAQTQAKSKLKLPATPSPYSSAGRTFESLASAHGVYTEDFAKKPGFGTSRMFFLPPQDFVTVTGKTYRFDTPELIGLENEPVVYERTGGMQELSVAIMSKAELRSQLKRRPLTLLESNAVVALRTGKDLVASPEPIAGGGKARSNTGLRVVGALRAQDNCAHCHGVSKGTLLGAFSYALTPTNLVALNAPKASRPAAPQIPKPRIPPPVGGTNLSITMAPHGKSPAGGAIASVRR